MSDSTLARAGVNDNGFFDTWMNVRGIFRHTVLAIVGLVGAAVVAVGLILLLGLNVNLNALRAPIADAASDALGRPFRIEGDVSVEASLWPTLSVESVRISNAAGFSEKEFASLGELRLKLGVLPLLDGKIYVRELIADGVEVNLESDANGDNNWYFGTSEQAPVDEGLEQATQEDKTAVGRPGPTFEVEKMSFSDITATYLDGALDRTIRFNLAEFSGRVGSQTPLRLETRGSLQDQSFSLAVNGPALEKLVDPGQVSRVTLSGDIADTPLDIGADFGYEKNEPKLGFRLELGSTDVGEFIAWLGVAEGLDLSAERFVLDVLLRGNSIDEIARNSEFSAELIGGHWRIRDAGGESPAVSIEKGGIRAGPGQPLSFTVKGIADRTPVTISIIGAPLIDYVKRDQALPIEVDVGFEDVKLELTGSLTVPIQQGPFNMDLSLSGDTLTTFNESLALDLPPLGPYRVSGKYASDETGIELTDLLLTVGESELRGKLNFDRTRTPPRLDVALKTPRLQLDDFDFEGWSAEGDGVDEEESDTAATEPRQETPDEAAGADKTYSLLSAETLNSVNARFDLDVEEVLSGSDIIGEGKLSVVLENGRLTVDPMHLTVPGGSVDLEFGYHPVADGVELYLKTLVDRFDYGILARRIDPDTNMGGKIFLDIALDAKAENIEGLLEGGRGHFDFALLPMEFDAGIFDLWAVNLLSSLSKKMDEAPTSVINCILARFTLEDGIMQDRVIFMDTTRMSVLGKAKINFPKQKLGIYAKPEAKRPEFFSLAVPVGVTGSFENWGLEIGIVPVTWAGISFVTSPVHVPIRRLFGGDKPLEGEAACRQAWRQSELPPLEPREFKSKALQ